LTEFFDPLTLEFHDPFRLRNLFELKGIDVDKPFAAYCASGIQSPAVALAAYKINREIPIYDGSMSEWCARNGMMEGTKPVPTAKFRNFDENSGSPGNSTWYKIHHLVMNMYHTVMRSLLAWNH